MKEEHKPHYSIPSNILYFYKYAYREYPRLAFYHLTLLISDSLLPFFGLIMPGIVLEMIEQRELWKGLGVIAAAGLMITLFRSLVFQFTWKTYFWENTLRTLMVSDAVLKGMKCLYKYVEYGEQKKNTRRAYQCMMHGDSAISYRMLGIPRELLVNIICFFLYSTVLSVLNPWLVALMIILSLLNYGIMRLRNKWGLALKEKFTQSNREINYLNKTFQNPLMAKDIRVFSMNDWLMDFRHNIFQKRLKLEKQNNRKRIFTDFLLQLLSLLRNGFAYGYLISAVLQGDMPASSFLVYFGAITGFSNFVTKIVNLCSSLNAQNVEASYYRAHMELPEINTLGTAPQELFRQPAEIEFRDVSFSYGDQKIYEHFNLLIRPGEKIALLGVNGAGKTTLVKLLCGLYEPDDGKIFINGVDTSTLPKRTLYDLFSIVFQESTILPYPVGCNLSFKRLSETDEDRAWAALREAGLENVLREKGVGLDTFMTNVAFDDGLTLSGGQTQRFLLARALYKGGNILILDEPTSALDPIAESQIYEEYVNISKGRTSLFISHRLASTRFSDRILFLENGKVVEEGTHEELIALGGSYAHMYEVQSHYYTETPCGLTPPKTES